ncbi:MAG: hypothetical protein EHM13_05485 [Acidobacteria bacterium]|nr:MAG: hypothetical protein EHM13_05485 [Acidobacteriota bacterium]
MLVLGAYHGINPGMGWLFAVALGMQHGNVRGVLAALPPIALGHAVAVGAVVLAAGLAGLVVPIGALKIVVASILVMSGLLRLWRHRHPRFGGMQVGFFDLTVWSFLMASAHGAGLMVLPFVLGVPADVAAASEHAGHMVARDAGAPWASAMAVRVHTLAYLLVTALMASVVYQWLGLRLLRTAWINLDWFWAGALVITGAVVLLT